jgi:hypothetical protein
MNPRPDETLIEKLTSLPPQERAEVEDFIDFLRSRRERVRSDASRRLGDAFAKLDALNQPSPSPEEIQAEIDAARAERRAPHADRR